MSAESGTTQLVDVTMPQMGVSVAEGTVVEWKKEVGETVERDEIICAISTDKIDTDVESPAVGRVQEILVEVGKTVDVGTVMARIAVGGAGAEQDEGHPPETRNGQPSTAGSGTGDQVAATGTSEATAALTAPGEAGELQGGALEQERAGKKERDRAKRYSPVVMRIAAEHDIDLTQVPGTGRGGRVRKQDVLAYVHGNGDSAHGAETIEPPLHIESPYRPEPTATAKPAEAPAAQSAPTRGKPEGEPPAPGIRESGPLSRMRQSIGRHMLDSLRTAATCTTINEVDMSRIEAARGQLQTTYLPFIARATIDTLREFPALNATLEGETFTTYDDVNLGIAVSLGEGGLIVPVIHRAQDYSVEGLARKIKELAQRARSNQLTPDDVRGGTFTITNPGIYGSILATPIINQPQVAILDTEAVVKRPVVIQDEFGDDAVAIRAMTYLCLSWDHRALDGALAAQFLAGLRKRLEGWHID